MQFMRIPSNAFPFNRIPNPNRLQHNRPQMMAHSPPTDYLGLNPSQIIGHVPPKMHAIPGPPQPPPQTAIEYGHKLNVNPPSRIQPPHQPPTLSLQPGHQGQGTQPKTTLPSMVLGTHHSVSHVAPPQGMQRQTTHFPKSHTALPVDQESKIYSVANEIKPVVPAEKPTNIERPISTTSTTSTTTTTTSTTSAPLTSPVANHTMPSVLESVMDAVTGHESIMNQVRFSLKEKLNDFYFFSLPSGVFNVVDDDHDRSSTVIFLYD